MSTFLAAFTLPISVSCNEYLDEDCLGAAGCRRQFLLFDSLPFSRHFPRLHSDVLVMSLSRDGSIAHREKREEPRPR